MLQQAEDLQAKLLGVKKDIDEQTAEFHTTHQELEVSKEEKAPAPI